MKLLRERTLKAINHLCSYLRDAARKEQGFVEVINEEFEDKLRLRGEWCYMCDVILSKPCIVPITCLHTCYKHFIWYAM